MYPVSYHADYQDGGRNRLTTFFRGVMVIPLLVVGWFYILAVEVAAFIAWFALMFTARFPQGLYDFIAGGVRFQTRMNSYYYLLTDAYPPFSGEANDGYPVRVNVAAPQERYSRLKVFFRGILLIPVWVVVMLYGIGLFVVTFLAWFAILFTGRYPAGMFNFARNAMGYTTRATAYMLLLTDQFPPVNEEPQVAAAAPVG